MNSNIRKGSSVRVVRCASRHMLSRVGVVIEIRAGICEVRLGSDRDTVFLDLDTLKLVA